MCFPILLGSSWPFCWWWYQHIYYMVILFFPSVWWCDANFFDLLNKSISFYLLWPNVVIAHSSSLSPTHPILLVYSYPLHGQCQVWLPFIIGPVSYFSPSSYQNLVFWLKWLHDRLVSPMHNPPLSLAPTVTIRLDVVSAISEEVLDVFWPELICGRTWTLPRLSSRLNKF